MRLRRSALFVPVGVERFYDNAAASGADVVVLDLEDAVPLDGKQQARADLNIAQGAVHARWCVVRVNADPQLLADDIAACAMCGVDEVLVPKVETVQDIAAVRRLIARHDNWHPALSVLVETLEGVQQLPGLVRDAGPIASLALGMEDLSAQLVLSAPGRTAPDELRWLHAQLLLWVGTSTIVPVGVIGELGNFTDIEGFQLAAVTAWRSGYRGTYCIHPRQVPIANAAYAPDDDDVHWANEVLDKAAEAYRQGRGAVAVRGRMVDAPIVRRARGIIEYRAAVLESDSGLRSAERDVS